MIAVPSSSRRFRSRSRICAWIVTSSAVVGSSAMSRSGSHARAMAIMIRWAMPPESSCGYERSRRSGSGMPTSCSSSSARFRASFRRMPRWISSVSPICRPTSQTGFNDDVGCWKIMASCWPRIERIWSARSLSRSRPSNVTVPASIRPGGGTRRMIDSEVTLLPQPDSPTRPMISPRSTLNEMPSTARTTPSRVANDVRRPETSRSGRSPRGLRRRRTAAGAISSIVVRSSDGPNVVDAVDPSAPRSRSAAPRSTSSRSAASSLIGSAADRARRAGRRRGG